MAKTINFAQMFSFDEIPDVYEMEESQLRSYREDLEGVVAAMAAKKAAGEYPEYLWK